MNRQIQLNVIMKIRETLTIGQKNVCIDERITTTNFCRKQSQKINFKTGKLKNLRFILHFKIKDRFFMRKR